MRSRPPGWRDPRLWVGVLLVALSVVGGARLLSSAEETTAVWALAVDLQAGDPIDADDLTTRQVRFSDSDDLARYLPAGESVPSGSRMVRAVGAGELLPRAAFAASVDTGVTEVPLSVASAQVPPGVGVGSVIDVWVVSDQPGEQAPAQLILPGVVVVAAPGITDSLVSATERQLVIGVPREAATAAALDEALGAAAAG
ncbi:MAG: hypothetical protein WAW88_13800, partial [Nocardioides sp.]